MDRIPEGGTMHLSLKKYSGYNTVPNIYINGTHIGGYSELMEGFNSGKVQRALDAPPPSV
jgi:glutaredoxin-related protein